MPSKPTQRSLRLLRSEGWTAWVAERWNKWARVRQDMGGFGDIIAWAPGRGVLAVQATDGTSVSKRIAKIRSLPAADAWVQSGARLEVWGWRKAGERGKRKTWQVRRVRITGNGHEEAA